MSEDDPVRTALADALRAGREEPQDDLDAVTERVVRELRRRGYEIRGTSELHDHQVLFLLSMLSIGGVIVFAIGELLGLW